MDHLRAAVDRLTAVGSTGEWFQGPRITWENLIEGNGPIQFIAPADLFFSAQAQPAPSQANTQAHRSAIRSAKPASPGPAKPARPASYVTMWFGKHKGKPLAVVREEDPGYWRWACREVGGFEKKAREAGLIDDL